VIALPLTKRVFIRDHVGKFRHGEQLAAHIRTQFASGDAILDCLSYALPPSGVSEFRARCQSARYQFNITACPGLE
jgi:hypothetical protein